MRRFLTLVLLIFIHLPADAQKIGDGLWNAGRAFSLVPVEHADKLELQKLVARVQLYPGFAVVRTDMAILNPGRDTIATRFAWQDSTTSTHPYFERINNLRSVARFLLLNGDTVHIADMFKLAPGLTTLTSFEITPDHQALLSRDGSVKEGNAFVYTIAEAPWIKRGPQQVLVQLSADLTMTNLMGIYPDSSASTTMTQVRFIVPDIQGSMEQNFVIWYNGAPPDMKFDKKVLPLKDQLYKEMDNFNLVLFDTPSFKQHNKHDFSVNKRSPFLSFLYFLMFSVPWILLIGFLVYLVFKPKKKKQA